MNLRASRRVSILAAAAALFAGMLVVPLAHAATDSGGVIWAQQGSALVVTSDDVAVCAGAKPEVTINWDGGSYSFTEDTTDNDVSLDPTTGAWSINVSGVLPGPGNYSLDFLCDEDTDSSAPDPIGTSLDVAITSLTAPATVTVGTPTSVTVAGFAAGETVSVTMPSSASFGSDTADSNGTVTFNITIPTTVTNNTYILTATGGTSGRTAAASVTTTGYTVTVDQAESEVISLVATSSSGGDVPLAGVSSDFWTFTVQLVGSDTNPFTGANTSKFTLDPAGPLVISAASDEGGGTYKLTVKSPTGGRFVTSVLYDGTQLGSGGNSNPLNFLGATVGQPVYAPGATVTAVGTGFDIDDTVDITLSGPTGFDPQDFIDNAVITENSDGSFSVTYALPADAPVGIYLMSFEGADSGTVSVNFNVANGGDHAGTSGSVMNTSTGLAGMILLIATGLALGAFQLRRRWA